MLQGVVMTKGTTVKTNDTILKCFGEAVAKYAANKHRGGSNGKKGTRYEDFFIAFEVANVIARHLEGGGNDWPEIGAQSEGFVDDVVLLTAISSEFSQLKNVHSLSWTGGQHPIVTDFEYQKVWAEFVGLPGLATTLVVSSAEVAHQMSANIPSSIARHTTVKSFPYCDGSMNRLVVESVELQRVLRLICKFENARLDELEATFGVIVLSCLDVSNTVSVKTLVNRTCQLYPNMLRLIVGNSLPQLDQRFTEILSKIAGLGYHVQRGFLNWSAFGTSGVLGFDCTDVQFIRFQDEVVNRHPTTFEDFEELLP